MSQAASEADRWFLRYQETGNPRALARVFDLVAGELLLLAQHLAPDSSTGEDLVQTTFVQAIQSANRYRPTVGVKPWLVSIMTNHARMEWRRIRRKIDPHRLLGERPVDPDFEVEAREFGRVVREALAGLPPHYREVVRLGLLHGMTMEEIARAVDVPREAVKSRWRRGMEMLRSGLPSGFALGALIVMTPGRGLAAVRDAVLARAEVHALHSAAITGWGIGALAKATALVTVLAGSVYLLSVTLIDGVRSAAEGSVAAVAGEPPQHPVHSHRGSRVPLAPAGLVPIRPGPAGRPRSADLRVRVTDHAGRPAPGVVVQARPNGDPSWLRERRARSGPDGVARFRELPAGGWLLRGDRGGRQEVELAPAQDGDAALQLPEGVPVRGLVLDKTGCPVADAMILLADPSLRTDEACRVATSGPDGRFEVHHVRPGQLITARVRGRLAPRWSRLPDDARDTIVRLQFRGPAPTVRGVVLGPEGAPVAGAAILAGHALDRFLQQNDVGTYRCRSDERGGFEIPGADPRRPLPLWVRAEGTAVWRGEVRCADAGEAPFVEVRLQRGTTVRGRVRSRSGAAAADVLVEARQERVEDGAEYAFTAPVWARATTRTDGEGRFTLDSIHPGRARLRASSAGGTATETLSLQDGQTVVWEPRLTLGRTVRGRVIDEAGEELIGWRVDLRGDDLDILRSTRTDDAGEFAFLGCEDHPHELLIYPPDQQDSWLHLTRRGVRPAAERVDYRVTSRAVPSCHVTGVALDPDGRPLPEINLIALHSVSHGQKPYKVRVSPTDSGRFAAGPLVPGVHEIMLQSRDGGLTHAGRRALVPGATLELGEVRFDRAGCLAVEVHDPDGSPSALSELLVWHRDDSRATTIRLAGGSGRTRPLQPGARCIGLWPPLRLPEFRTAHVRPGQTATVRIDLRGGGVPVTFRYRAPRGRFQFELSLFRGDELVFRERRGLLVGEDPIEETRNVEAGTYRVRLVTVSGAVREAVFVARSAADRATAEFQIR